MQTQVWPMLRNLAATAPGHGGIEIGIVKNDEGRIAAEFQRHLFHGACRLLHQELADGRGTGEATNRRPDGSS